MRIKTSEREGWKPGGSQRPTPDAPPLDNEGLPVDMPLGEVSLRGERLVDIARSIDHEGNPEG